MQLTQCLHRNVQQSSSAVATVFQGREATWAECGDRVARLAAGLRALGVAAGDRVAVLSLNSDRYHDLLFATWWAGGVVNPVNIRWSPAEIAYSLEDSGSKVLVVDDAFAPMVATLRATPGVEAVVHAGDGETPEGVLPYDALLDHGAVPDAGRGGDDVAGIFYTGGTTGFPKGVALSHDSLLVSALGAGTTDRLVPGGCLLHAAPMFHLADLSTWLLRNVVGGRHVILPMFTPEGVLDAIEAHRPDEALLVPTMMQMLVDSPLAVGRNLGSLGRIIYGGSPISEGLLDRVTAVFPNARLTQSYGMTELSPCATILRHEEHADPVLRRSAGRAAAHAMVKVVDVDGKELPRGQVGEVVVSGGHVMLGYWGRPEDTATSVVDGWMHTGDAGRMDDEGYLYIVDRIKDMIVTGGENVYSAEVEGAVATHPSVAACAVVGVPDPEWGERVHAVLVLQPDATVELDELRAYCKERIAGYKCPRSLEVVEALPLSGAGKVLKRELRARYWTDADRGVG